MNTCCRKHFSKVNIQIKNVTGSKEVCWSLFELAQYGFLEDDIIQNAIHKADDNSCTFSEGGFKYRLLVDENCIIID